MKTLILILLFASQALANSPWIYGTNGPLSLQTLNPGVCKAVSDELVCTATTDDLTEGSTNLYYTDARVSAFVSPIYAPLNSPALTGVPTAPTAATGTNTTQIATTAFVTDATSQPMPSASTTSLVNTTSTSTTFVTALSTSITVTAASAPVLAKCVLDMSSATAASVGSVVVTINAVSGGAVRESFTVATTQRLTVPNQYLSAALSAGTYTVTCDFNRISGTGTVTVNQGSLTAVALQGSRAVTGLVTLAGGGTNASLTASNGAIAYSDADSLELSAVGSSGQILRSAGAGAPTWTAETFPASTTINQILYSSANNVVSGLATANTGALVTSSTGVPSITSGATANRLLRTNGTTVSFAQANLTTDVTGTLPLGNGGTGATAFATSRVPFSNGTNLLSDPEFLWDNTNKRLALGNPGNARLTTTISSGSALGIGAQCEGTNNCVQIRNNVAYNLAMLQANDANTYGVLVGAERSRGTQTSRTQALNGDTGLNLVGSCYTGSASSAGFSSAIQYVLTENCTGSANGGEMIFYTTPNTTTTALERFRFTQGGHFKSTQASAPTATVNANAGTGATCSVSNATDTAGIINLTTTAVAPAAGIQCSVNFDKAFTTAPICTVTPNNNNAGLFAVANGDFFTTTTTTLDINYANADAAGHANTWMYHCIETQ